ncbi:PEPxxWA-CTERM sorting domain-containing protein [Sphingomonas panacisoli]|uniref:PEPxxWA-CTERM sorting domain-containing protein n=1 Tax=Sphingomonas panacisoli TaxID=1813879 RepID=UPI001F011EE4|nr:PEPxxWA-CTERM sorting domain-containing protein [Sphingomonas panacisoli]
MRFAMLVAAIGAACLSVPSWAADYSVKFTATNFRQSYDPSLNVPPPVSPVTFDALLHIDLSGNTDPTTNGLTVNSFNLPYGVEYAYDRASDTLIFGTQIDVDAGGNYYIQPAPSSWFVAIGGALIGSPVAFNFVQMVVQTTPGNPYTYSTTDVTFDIVRLDAPANSPVPEPATWAMMIVGFGAIGGLLRRATSPSYHACLSA